MSDKVTKTQLKEVTDGDYKYGFVTDIESEKAPIGLDKSTIHFISAKKNEPKWVLNWRLKAFAKWQQLHRKEEPNWPNLKYPPIDFQKISYYAAPKNGAKYENIEDIPKELLETYKKLGIPLKEQKNLADIKKTKPVAVNAVFDSVSITTTFKKELAKAGVIFCSISEAVQKHPNLIQKYLGSVIPQDDNMYATLNSAVFSDGSFVYIPKNVICPIELSTYFRMNATNTGQFERTLIIADEGSQVSYLEGCSAPQRDENQLHAAVVELVALEGATIKYSTVQNWYPGDSEGKGGIYNFVTKRGACRGKNSKISWIQIETGSAITWTNVECANITFEKCQEFG